MTKAAGDSYTNKKLLQEFNKDRKDFLTYCPGTGLFYYTDTAYNVTSELLKGLNDFTAKKN
jgi:hypothetical protein